MPQAISRSAPHTSRWKAVPPVWTGKLSIAVTSPAKYRAIALVKPCGLVAASRVNPFPPDWRRNASCKCISRSVQKVARRFPSQSVTITISPIGVPMRSINNRSCESSPGKCSGFCCVFKAVIVPAGLELPHVYRADSRRPGATLNYLRLQHDFQVFPFPIARHQTRHFIHAPRVHQKLACCCCSSTTDARRHYNVYLTRESYRSTCDLSPCQT